MNKRRRKKRDKKILVVVKVDQETKTVTIGNLYDYNLIFGKKRKYEPRKIHGITRKQLQP